MDEEHSTPKLGASATDISVSTAKAFLGLIPFVGAPLAELIGLTVPNQRLDRIADYVVQLEKRIANFDVEQNERVAGGPAHIDLFEEGALRATRATTAERRAQIAAIVAKGLSSNDRQAIEAKRLLDIFSALDQDDVVMLKFYDVRNGDRYEEFTDKHAYLLEPLHATVVSEPEIRKRAALRAAITSKLVRYDLIRETLKSRTGGVPGITDQLIEGSGDFRITELGRMILQEAGLIDATE